MTDGRSDVAVPAGDVPAGTASDRQGAGSRALTVLGLSKTFTRSPVLDQLNLEVGAGQVHALLGENGSGKSTLIKILSGFHQPDSGGRVWIGADALEFGSAESSYRLGCRFVHQDLGLVVTESIMDNLAFASGFNARFGTIRRKLEIAEAREDLGRLGLDLDPTTPVGSLTASQRTGVAVARALRERSGDKVRLLVLDEPTATLPANEVDHLLEIVRAVAGSGVGVLYVTHRLEEVFRVADHVSVLRDGRLVSTAPATALDHSQLVTLLVGRELDEVHDATVHLPAVTGSPILEVTGVVAGPLQGVGLEVRPGEVVGCAGITGSGRETILGSIFGAIPRESGTVRIAGHELRPGRPDLAIEAGMAFLPPDRKALGSIMDLTGRENLTISHLRPFWRRWRLSRREERTESRSWFDRLGVRPAGAIEERLSSFSGGNQQKILFGKWLRREPRIFLLDEPTQGVDIGAKAELHRQLISAASDGTAVLVASSDVEEIAALCTRVLVLRDGHVVAELVGDEITVPTITHRCSGERESLAGV